MGGVPEGVRGELISESRSRRVAVGLIGLGAIGLSVVQLLREETKLQVVGGLVRRPGGRGNIPDLVTVHLLKDLLELRPDVVAEVAGHSALKAYGPRILRSQCDLVITSVGALADEAFFAEMQAAAVSAGRSVEMVAGAVGALDAIAAAAVGRLDRVAYVARRPPDHLLAEVKPLDSQEEREIFAGTAREAALKYPDRLNVAAALGFAGLGLDRTEVRVIVDPKVETIHHEIFATGQFGTLSVGIRNSGEVTESPSRLVAMSVVRALRSRSWAPIRIV